MLLLFHYTQPRTTNFRISDFFVWRVSANYRATIGKHGGPPQLVFDVEAFCGTYQTLTLCLADHRPSPIAIKKSSTLRHPLREWSKLDLLPH
ncbi:hypothetical protein C7476_108146 [Phyllobacterium bourgognense]|uniref:Uncharacterized protein n=1 Tax=Phyllobacterium bourgognense TaxID=314236 RepID=A0A368YQ31_9HYPH|nr:hypothetical protein C7476_108146 [Phyllobacterium bourgognense]